MYVERSGYIPGSDSILTGNLRFKAGVSMQETDNQLLQAVLSVIISVVVPALAFFVASWLKAQANLLNMKMTAEQKRFVDALVYDLVAAAEQYNLAGLAAQSGREKKAWVVGKAQEKLDEIGLQWDAAALADIVEAKILEGATAAWEPAQTTGTADSSGLGA